MVLPRAVVALAAHPLEPAANASFHSRPSLAVDCIPRDFEGGKLAGMFLLAGSMSEAGKGMTMDQQDSKKAADMMLGVVLHMVLATFLVAQYAEEMNILPR